MNLPDTTAVCPPSSPLGVDEARSRINAALPLMKTEEIELDIAAGRVLARDVSAVAMSPPFDVSSMDGFAVRSGDVLEPGKSLVLAGSSRPGDIPISDFPPGHAVRIFTGAPVPAEADSIVIQENADLRGERVTFSVAAMRGQYIRPRGGNFRPGDKCVDAGTWLSARHIGLLAAAGHSTVHVYRQPRIGVLSTGDEITQTGELTGGAIHDANRPAVKAAIRAFGAIPVDLGIVRDSLEEVTEALRNTDCDFIVTTGGASVGDHDHVRPALMALGARLAFWKIRMRPGKPLMFGELDGLPILGMPGNPVSAMVCALLFLRPAIATMMGTHVLTDFDKVVLATALEPTAERDDYIRARIFRTADGLQAAPLGLQDSSMSSNLAHADGLIVRKAGASAARAGEIVDVIRFDTCGGF